MSSRTTSLKLARLKGLGDNISLTMLENFDSKFMDDLPTQLKSRKFIATSVSSKSSDGGAMNISDPQTPKDSPAFSVNEVDVTVIHNNGYHVDPNVKTRSRVQKSKSVFDFSDVRVQSYLSSMSSDNGVVSDPDFTGFANPDEIDSSLKINIQGTVDCSCKGFCRTLNVKGSKKAKMSNNSFIKNNTVVKKEHEDTFSSEFYPKSIRILAKTLCTDDDKIAKPKTKMATRSQRIKLSIVHHVKKRLVKFKSKAKISKKVAKTTIAKTVLASPPKAKGRKPIIRIPLGVRRSKRIRKKRD